MKPLYTEVFTLKISSTQKRTLEKLKSRNIKISDFVRKASVEKRRNALKDCGLYERQSIKVLQYDLDNNFIQKFNSISEASEKTNTNRTSLSQCLNNKLKSANKFIWKRENN